MVATAESAQASVSALATRASGQLGTLWPDLVNPDAGLMKDQLIPLLEELLLPQYEASAALAADWYTVIRPATADPFEPVLAEKVGLGRLVELANAGLAPLFVPGPERNFVLAQDLTSKMSESLVVSGFRETIQKSVAADPVAESWERVLSPKACDWCRRLEGDEYHTEGQFESHRGCHCTNKPKFRA